MRRGEIVEVDWTFSDMTGSKMRPAVVVQADFLNGLIDDTLLVQITSTRHGIPGTEVAIDPAAETGSSLSRLCYASCTNILTRDQALVGRTIGYLSDALMAQVGACLKTALELPWLVPRENKTGTAAIFAQPFTSCCPRFSSLPI